MASDLQAANGLRSSRVSTRLERKGAEVYLQPLHPLTNGVVSLALPVRSLAREQAEATSTPKTYLENKEKATETCNTYRIGY